MAPFADGRTRQTQVLPERWTLVVQMVQPAALQFGDNEPAEFLVAPRNVRGGDNIAVAGAIGEPLLQPVRDVLRAAHEARVIVEGAAAADVDEIARRRQAIAEFALHPVAHALHAGPGVDLL